MGLAACRRRPSGVRRRHEQSRIANPPYLLLCPLLLMMAAACSRARKWGDNKCPVRRVPSPLHIHPPTPD